MLPLFVLSYYRYYRHLLPGIGITDMDACLRHVGVAWFDNLRQRIRQNAATDTANGLGTIWTHSEFQWPFNKHRSQVAWISSRASSSPATDSPAAVGAVQYQPAGAQDLHGLWMALTWFTLPHWIGWKWKTTKLRKFLRVPPIFRPVLKRTMQIIQWGKDFMGRDHVDKPSWSCHLALQYTSSCLLLSMLIVLRRRSDLFLLARIHTFDGSGIPCHLYVPMHLHLFDMAMLMGRVQYLYQARHWESSRVRASMIVWRSLGSCCFSTNHSCKMLQTSRICRGHVR